MAWSAKKRQPLDFPFYNFYPTMKIDIIHKNGLGISTTKVLKLSTLGLLKHFGLAGQNYGTTMRAIRRAIGMYFQYSDFFNQKSLSASKFSRPLPSFYDPTEIGDFSTIAGKAIADFLARRLDNATHTHTYEAAMHAKGHRLSSKSRRPDLYCYGGGKQFSVESKGFSDATVSENAMAIHKSQSAQGPLKINFSVASVAYNLYDKIRVKYYDPINEDNEFDYALNLDLSRNYYRGFVQLLDSQSVENIFLLSINNKNYFLVQLFPLNNDLSSTQILLLYPWLFRAKLYLAIHTDVKKFAIEGNLTDLEYYDDDLTYIDNDGIGLAIR